MSKSARSQRAVVVTAAPELDAPYSQAAIEALVARFGSPLLVLDCERVRTQYRRLSAALPGVDLHYALKPQPDPTVVATLKEEGAWFDLATSGEVQLVKSVGIDPARCIHTHPIKRDADIRDAIRFGVRTFVVDNPDEILKFTRHRRRAELLLRVAFRSPNAVVDLSRKFGCDPEAVPQLLALARRHGIRVIGLSFHVGSQSTSPDMHVQAVNVCAALIRAANADGGELMTLDIGGGFPAEYGEPVMPIEQFCAPIVAALANVPAGTRIIAEPGRYIVAPVGTSIATVMGRAERDGRMWYYLDDGAYGAYSGQMYDHMQFPLQVLREGPLRPSVLAGPTCDSIDVIREDIALPELVAGDLVIGHCMGAYTNVSATDFNFFPRPRIVPVNVGRSTLPE